MEIPASSFFVCFAALVGYFLLSASLHGYPMNTDDAGQLVALLQQARS